MGLNIVLYNFAPMREGKSKLPERDARFDSLRYSGDREFSTWIGQEDNGEFTSLTDSLWDFDCYERPKDLQKAREWVKANIVEDNQKRWLDLFDLLETDTKKSLWLQEYW